MNRLSRLSRLTDVGKGYYYMYQYQPETILGDEDIHSACRREGMGHATSLVRERQEIDDGFQRNTNVRVRSHVHDILFGDNVYLGA